MIDRLERECDELNEPLEPLKSFVLPGGAEAAARLHVARTVCRRAEIEVLTLGQYLRPSRQHLPLQRYYTPTEFMSLRRIGLELGFRHVQSGPLVRSSYHAAEQVPDVPGSVAV